MESTLWTPRRRRASTKSAPKALLPCIPSITVTRLFPNPALVCHRWPRWLHADELAASGWMLQCQCMPVHASLDVYAAVAWSATGLPLAAVKYKISWNSGNMPKVVIALRPRIRNVVGPGWTLSNPVEPVKYGQIGIKCVIVLISRNLPRSCHARRTRNFIHPSGSGRSASALAASDASDRPSATVSACFRLGPSLPEQTLGREWAILGARSRDLVQSCRGLGRARVSLDITAPPPEHHQNTTKPPPPPPPPNHQQQSY